MGFGIMANPLLEDRRYVLSNAGDIASATRIGESQAIELDVEGVVMPSPRDARLLEPLAMIRPSMTYKMGYGHAWIPDDQARCARRCGLRRIMVTQIGEPRESLAVHEVPELQPEAGEVLVEMLAIPIHPADLLVMRGRHVFTPSYPCGTGIEGAGRVVGHGPGVSQPGIGQRVALPFGGTWAEQVTLPAASVIPLPDDVDLHQGAMVALNPVTALGLLMGMKPGQWLLHNAANSSLARLITRVAADKGIHSISVVRRAGMEAELKANGADHVLVDGEDLPQRVHAILGGRGVDRALDAVAGRASGRMFDSVADFGTLICYGLLGGDEVIIPAAQLIFRDVQVRGYSRLRYLRSLSREDAELLHADLFAGLEKGLFHTPILSTFAFADIAQAVELAESSSGAGKVLLIPPGVREREGA